MAPSGLGLGFPPPKKKRGEFWGTPQNEDLMGLPGLEDPQHDAFPCGVFDATKKQGYPPRQTHHYQGIINP